jgi:hypothetical protein
MTLPPRQAPVGALYFFNGTITASLNAFAASSETLLLNGNGRRQFSFGAIELRTCGSNTTVNY